MRYHNHGFVLAATEGFDDVFYKTAVAVVESVERLIDVYKRQAENCVSG